MQPALPPLRTAEVARMLGVSARTVRDMVARGELTACQASGTKGPRGRRITRASLERHQAQLPLGRRAPRRRMPRGERS